MTIQTNIDERVTLAPYDPAWPQLFEQEQQTLKKCLGDYAIDIRHIGSTAVPGLSAKPVIDIMIGADIYPAPEEILTLLQEVGYTYHGECNVPGRQYLTKRRHQPFNLAIVQSFAQHWQNNLKFVDILRSDPTLRLEYAELKSDILRSVNTLLAYSSHKSKFIQAVLSNGLVDLD